MVTSDVNFQYAKSVVSQGRIISIDMPLINGTFRPNTDLDILTYIDWKFSERKGWIKLLDYRSHVIVAYNQWLEDKNTKSFRRAFYQNTPCFGQFYIKNRAPFIELTDINSSNQEEPELMLTLGGRFDHDEFRVVRNIKKGYNAIHNPTKICFIESRPIVI